MNLYTLNNIGKASRLESQSWKFPDKMKEIIQTEQETKLKVVYTVYQPYLPFSHICSNASASSTFDTSSASWNLRKPSPPCP